MEQKTLLELCRSAERVVSTMTDDEIQMLIDAAVAEMRRVGVRESSLGISDGEMDESKMNPLARYLIVMFVKANYGHDDATEFQIWDSRYTTTLTALMNSSMNECAE